MTSAERSHMTEPAQLAFMLIWLEKIIEQMDDQVAAHFDGTDAHD